MASANPSRVYEEYDPPSDLVTEEGCDTILIYLPGYRKEQLRVQLTTTRILRISGERHIDGNKWRRFSKEFRVPSDCDVKEITAKYEGGILYIRQPKLTASSAGAPATAEQPADRRQTSAARPLPPPLQQAPDIPHRQPQQQAPDIPHRQPQQRVPELPQPRAQQEDPVMPRPQPQPQPMLRAPLPEHQEGLEEKAGRKDSPKDAVRKEKDDDRKDNCEFKARPARVRGRGGFYRELSKPNNCKRLVVSVLLVLGIGFYLNYTFKTFLGETGYDKEL